MNRYIKFLIVGIVGFLSICELSAQLNNSKIRNNILFWGTSGQSAMHTDISNLNSLLKLGFGLGTGYELQYKSFSLQTGVEFTYLQPAWKLDEFSIDVENLYDDEGDRYLGHYTFSESTDSYKFGNINVPLLVGFNKKKYYLLAGIKLNINLLAANNVKAQISSSGTYENYLGTFENMPNHGFGTYNSSKDFPVKLAFNYAATAEAGLNFGTQNNFRLGVFFDYGLQNINYKTKEDIVLFGLDNVPYLNNFMSGFAKPANLIYSGVKFTVLLKIKDKYDCKCYDF